MAVVAPRAASADDAVALLPLDADARLEIYGQPVASEVARALVVGGVDVVVVGPKMAVPERARLIVDGKISAGKGDTVVLALRIRDRESGTVLDTISSDAAQLTSIDQAAADLSARALPQVRARLAAIHAAKLTAPPDHVDHGPARPALVAPRPFGVAVTALGGGSAELQPALALATAAWVRARHREPHTAATFIAVAKPAAPAELSLEIMSYVVEPGAVPLAHAGVHVVLRDGTGPLFDRVIVTDTIVGDKGQAPARLAERVAAEVLAIFSPNAVRAQPDLAVPRATP